MQNIGRGALAGLILVTTASGCAVSSEDELDELDQEEEEADSDTDEDTPTPDTPTEGDRVVFDSMLDGQTDAWTGIIAVAWSAGWPMASEGQFFFVRLDDGRGPYSLAGDHNDWKPEPMTQGPGFYWIAAQVDGADGGRYKFVTAAGAWEADPMARRYDYDDNGELSLIRSSAAHLERWPQAGGTELSPRDLRVWVPTNTATRHLYVHDGQNLFNPSAPWGGWRLQDSLPDGILVVGIDNTADRMSDYTHVTDSIGGGEIGGGGDVYADFVELSVRPHIEAIYGQPSVTGIMGSSLGGLISLHIADRYPDSYDFVASLSGTLGWGSLGMQNPTIIERYQSAGVRSFRIYVDSGGQDGGGCFDGDADGILDDSDFSDNYCTTRQFADSLAALDYEWNTELWHWFEPDAPHNEAAWAARVFRPLQIFSEI